MNDFDRFDETPVWVDEYKPIPPKNTWSQMSEHQLSEIKSRIIGYSNSFSQEHQKDQRAMMEENIAYLTGLINKTQ